MPNTYDFETPALAAACEGMEIEPDAFIDVRDVEPAEGRKHQHVAIQWQGGVIWLDMSHLTNHYCIDVRQFNEDGEMKGQGFFTIVNGCRAALGGNGLKDTEGRIVRGHKWDGGYVMTLLTDEYGDEETAIKPSPGNG